MSDHALDIVCAPHHLFLIANLVNHIEQVDRKHERTWLEHVIATNDSHAASPIPPTPPLPAPEWGNLADVSGWGDPNINWRNTNWGDVPMNEADIEWASPVERPRHSPPPRDSPSPTPQHLRPMPDHLRFGAPPPTRTRPSPRSPSPTPHSLSPANENAPPIAVVVDPASPLEWPASAVHMVLGTISGGDLTDATDPDALSAPPAPPTPPLRQPRPRTPPYPAPALGPTTVHWRTPLLGHPAYGGALLYDKRLLDGWQIGPEEPRHVQLPSYAWDERWEQIPGVDNTYLIGVLGDNLHPSGRFTETQYLGFLWAMIQARDPAARVTDHDVWREAADNLVDAYNVRNIPVSVCHMWGNFYDDEILDVFGYGDSPPPTPATSATPVEEVLRSRSPSPVSPHAVVHDIPADAIPAPFRPERPAPANPLSRSPSPPAASSTIASSPSRAITFISGGYFNPANPGLDIGLWYPPAPSSPLTEPDLELNDRDNHA
ncbi:hypothetical protein DICSQDRAFT_173632 [Dichomitus squalens LYAD-421 SS1]|uniref:Uncharacterized protein n=1 Tax=Dichomitus squalens (strain LYAD-421) TaxID=732165 RepID=R7SS24_DICSQ|nr:uncharacterized protein DICSQDRAFT_173632 [Dichomitus squalens LYAD-421 SS1]EJF57762.1 hypothetical protein DICSQDRAFT_173632 [Dichomitus squalens LYAD-421 SS1]